MGTKNNPGPYDCYAALDPDEPYFVLRANDKSAASVVEGWAMNRSHQIDRGEMSEDERAKVKEAYEVAKAMREWYEAKIK